MNRHPVKWLSPAPVWAELTRTDVAAFVKPDILRFSSDSFMNDFLKQLETDPSHVSDFRAKPETWRGPAQRLKLYQPAHQRHYLVTASLICQIPGLPDRAVDTTQEEGVSFIMRRLLASGTGEREEYALLNTADGYVWTKVVAGQRTSPDVLVPGEELLPMFTVNYTDKGNSRRLFAGSIPVGKQEIYENSILDAASIIGLNGAATTAKTARTVLFQTDVIAPWENLTESAVTLGSLSGDQQFVDAADFVDSDDIPSPGSADRLQKISGQLKASSEQIQTGSWYILLDFAKYLIQYLPKVWQAVQVSSASDLNPNETSLYDTLGQVTNRVSGSAVHLRSALHQVIGHEEALEAVVEPYDSAESNGSWPNFIFPLATPTVGDGNALKHGVPSFLPESLLALIEEALPEETTEPVPEIPLAAKLSKQGRLEEGDSVYVIRCVYQRPKCHPVHLDVVSEPTEQFQLAGFFDPDAPARPITITLPADPTPAGLRKYAKNTAFMMSDALCGQLGAIKKVTFGDLVLSVLPWPFHKSLSTKIGKIKSCKDKDEFSIGRVCSLSIPIVTISAMFLLMMIVLILDFVFRWVPFLISCFPLPKFKSKP